MSRSVRGIATKLAADIGARLFQLGFIIVVARWLGAQGFGIYNVALFYGYLFSQLADFGLHLLTTREASKTKLDNNNLSPLTIESAALTAKIWLSLGLIGVSAVAALFYGSSWAEYLAFFVISSSFVVFSLAEFAFSLFRAWGKLEWEAGLVLFNRLLLLVLGGAALGLNWGLGGIALAHLVSSSVAALIALRWARPVTGWQIAQWRETLPLYGQALPLGFGLILSMLAFRIDVPLLYAFRNEAEVGFYSAAYRLFEPGLLFPAALLAGFFPRMVRMVQASGMAIKATLPLLATLLGLGIIGGSGLIILANPLIGLVYGTKFEASAEVLRVLGLVVPVIFLNYGLTHVLIAHQRESWNTLFFGVALATNLIANLALIPSFGGVGAAWATLATEMVLGLLCLFGLWRLKQYNIIGHSERSEESQDPSLRSG